MINSTDDRRAPSAQMQSLHDAPAAQPPVGWAYQLAPIKRPSSGFRVAAGIISIVLSLWVTLFYIQMTTRFSYYHQPNAKDLTIMTFMFICMWASFVGGIVLLTKHRARGKIAPSVVGISAICGFIGFGIPASYNLSFPTMLSLAASVVVVALVLVDMKRTPPRTSGTAE